MIDLLASVILLLLWVAILIWAWGEELDPRLDTVPGLVFAASTLIIGVTILGLLGLVDDPYCLRCG